jgi:hypothetical protein
VEATGVFVALPLENEYEEAPVGFITKLVPGQIDPLLTAITGLVETVTFTMAAVKDEHAPVLPHTE